MNVLRVAVVACGFTGQQHVEAVRRIPGTQVVAMADPQAEALRAKTEIMGIDAAFEDWREMVDSTKPDVVHNCTPNHLHYEVNRYCMERGIHVYCEKPLAVTPGQGEELVALAQEKRLACGVNFNYRHNAMVQEMRQRVLSGGIGRIFHVTGQYLQDWMMLDSDYNWRLSIDEGGESRAVADIGSHWFDTAQWACGRRIAAVRAQLFTVHPQRQKPIKQVETFASSRSEEYELVPVTTEDAAFISVRFEDGTPGNLVLSQVGAGHKNDLRLEIAGERYSMEWRQESADQLNIGRREDGNLLLRSAPELLQPGAARYATLPGGHPVAWSDALRNGIGEYYRSIRQERWSQTGQTYATFADAAHIMRLVAACLESNRSGQWVEVPAQQSVKV